MTLLRAKYPLDAVIFSMGTYMGLWCKNTVQK